MVTDLSNITKTKYAGNYIYEEAGGIEELKFFNQPEGYVEPTGDVNKPFQYVYQYLDHLGNIRLSYSDADGNGSINASTEIIEENNYYPFGLKHKGYNNNVSASVNSMAKKFKFNGQEYDESLGLNVTEMSFRQYDNAIGRFMSIDRLSEFATSLTPYRFGFNNPISFGDPSGLYEVDDNGNYKVTNPDEIKALMKKIGYTGNYGGVDGLIRHMHESDDFAEELDEIVINVRSNGNVKNSDYSNAVYNAYNQVQSSLNKISSNNSGWTIEAGMMRMSNRDVKGIGLSIEFATPAKIPGTNIYGLGLDFGLLRDKDGSGGYWTDKSTDEPGVAFNISIEYFRAVKTSSDPSAFISRNNLREGGFESSFGAGPVGGAYGVSNSSKYHKSSPFISRTGSIGAGINVGYVNWLTTTYVTKK